MESVAKDTDGTDYRYRWPDAPSADLDGDGLLEVFLSGTDGGMLIRGDDLSTYWESGVLPSSGPGRYAGSGYPVRLRSIDQEDGPALLVASGTSVGTDNTFNRVVTRTGSELDETDWGSGGSGTWPAYDTWILYSSSSAGQPRHWTTGDIDGDGLTDAIGLQDGLKIFLGSNRPVEGEPSSEKMTPILTSFPTRRERPHSWVNGWASNRRDVWAADMPGGALSLLTLTAMATTTSRPSRHWPAMAKGRAWCMSTQVTPYGEGEFNVDEEGTPSCPRTMAMPAFVRCLLAATPITTVFPIYGLSLKISMAAKTTKSPDFVFDGSIETTVVSVDSAYASWSPPMARLRRGRDLQRQRYVADQSR